MNAPLSTGHLWCVRLLLLIVTMLSASGLEADSARFSRFSVEDGLSQSSVESIAEDRYGFLWMGTQEGLNRFDGYQFKVHKQSRRPGHLRDGFIRAITPDARGDLWIGTETGIQHLDVASGRFGESVTPEGIGSRLNTLLVETNGRLWFAGEQGGLWTRAPHDGAIAEPIATDVVPVSESLSALTFGASGDLWIAAHDDLLSLEIAEDSGAVSVSARTALRDIGFVRVLYVDERGAIWIGRQHAPPLRFDPATGETTEYPELPHHTLTINSARDGSLWIGGKDGGLISFDPGTRELVTYRHDPGNEDSLAENDVAIIHKDRSESLWVGAWNGGVSRLNLYAQAFRTLRHNPGEPASLPDNDVTRMAEGPDGRLWTITRNDVVAVGDPKGGTFATVPFDRDTTAIAFTGSHLFAGTTTGLLEVDATSGEAHAPSDAIRAAGLDQASIAILRGSDSALWIVTGEEVFRVSRAGGTDTIERATLPFQREPTSAFAPSPDRLWIAYAEGVLLHVRRGEDGALTVTQVGDGSLGARGRLRVVTEDRGVVWLGTARGIGRLSPSGNRVAWLDLEEGMPSRTVAGILPDDSGALWIATNRGITRYDPASARAVHFGAVQGAQPSGYVEGGAARGASGLFYFAGRGITVLDPELVRDNPHRPRALFTSLEVLHRPVLPSWIDHESPLSTGVHAANEVTLGPDALVFSVEMAAPGASDPGSVHYAHRLDGFDDEWIVTTADRRIATYTRLAPGNYLLRARARSQSGSWSAQEATLAIQILPPWWRTPAAIGLWVVMAILATALVVRAIRRRTQMRIALAEQEVLRRASVTDPLTGLYNRRFLDTWVRHEVPRALRSHRAASESKVPRESLLILIVDLDNLKEINDAFGHEAGDRTIRAVAGLLESHARAEDVAVRWGGDEFILVLRSADPSQASHVAERLRASAETLDLNLGLDSSPHCTISLGYASFPFLPHDPEALTWEQTLQIADRALLQSKRIRRNTWTGFIATPATTADAILADLETNVDRPVSSVDVVERPVGDESSEDSSRS